MEQLRRREKWWKKETDNALNIMMSFEDANTQVEKKKRIIRPYD
jgi:hypothetical protein